MREIKALTGLRFVAAFAVLNGHFAMTAGGSLRSARLPLAFHAPMTLFFALSGFVLTWTYAEGVSTRRFLWARFARIYPLFAFVFLLEALVNGIPAGAFWSHALLLQSWGTPRFFEVSWSLSVEAFFYACFPVLAAILAKMGCRALVRLAFVAWSATVAIGVVAYSGVLPLERALMFPPARLPVFVFGCAMARLAMSGVRPPAGTAGVIAVVIAGLASLTHLPRPVDQDALYLVPFGLLMLSLATTESRVGRVLGSAAMLRLGAASYALYLVHPLIRQAAWASFGPVLSFPAMLVGMAASVAASFLLFSLIEAPARRWLRRGAERPRDDTVAGLDVVPAGRAA